MKQDKWNDRKPVKASVNLGLIFVTIKNVGIMINVSANAKDLLIMECNKGFNWNPSNCECECYWIFRLWKW